VKKLLTCWFYIVYYTINNVNLYLVLGSLTGLVTSNLAPSSTLLGRHSGLVCDFLQERCKPLLDRKVCTSPGFAPPPSSPPFTREEIMEVQQIETGSRNNAVTRRALSLTLSLHEAPLLPTNQCRRQCSRGAKRKEVQSTAPGDI